MGHLLPNYHRGLRGFARGFAENPRSEIRARVPWLGSRLRGFRGLTRVYDSWRGIFPAAFVLGEKEKSHTLCARKVSQPSHRSEKSEASSIDAKIVKRRNNPRRPSQPSLMPPFEVHFRPDDVPAHFCAGLNIFVRAASVRPSIHRRRNGSEAQRAVNSAADSLWTSCGHRTLLGISQKRSSHEEAPC